MNPFFLNLLIALAWVAVTGEYSLAGFIIGFVVGLVLVEVAGPLLGGRGYARRVGRAVLLGVFFVRDLVQANLRVAVDVLSPRPSIAPAIIAIPLEVEKPVSITLLANLITLTPGTLSVDVSADQRTLYVHAMYAGDVAEAVDEIKTEVERRVKEVLES